MTSEGLGKSGVDCQFGRVEFFFLNDGNASTERYTPTTPANLKSQQYWLNRRILSNPLPFPLKVKIIPDICQQLTYLGISSFPSRLY